MKAGEFGFAETFVGEPAPPCLLSALAAEADVSPSRTRVHVGRSTSAKNSASLLVRRLARATMSPLCWLYEPADLESPSLTGFSSWSARGSTLIRSRPHDCYQASITSSDVDASSKCSEEF
jgi:hypothetical protein